MLTVVGHILMAGGPPAEGHARVYLWKGGTLCSIKTTMRTFSIFCFYLYRVVIVSLAQGQLEEEQ